MKWLIWIAGIIVVLLAIVYAIGAALPERHTVVRVTRYRQSQDAIWQVITDYDKFPSWRSNVRERDDAYVPKFLCCLAGN